MMFAIFTIQPPGSQKSDAYPTRPRLVSLSHTDKITFLHRHMTKNLTYREAAEALGVSWRTIREAVRRGELFATRFNARVIRISETDLREWRDMRKCADMRATSWKQSLH